MRRLKVVSSTDSDIIRWIRSSKRTAVAMAGHMTEVRGRDREFLWRSYLILDAALSIVIVIAIAIAIAGGGIAWNLG